MKYIVYTKTQEEESNINNFTKMDHGWTTIPIYVQFRYLKIQLKKFTYVFTGSYTNVDVCSFTFVFNSLCKYT